MSATKIGPGFYHYRGVEIFNSHDNEDYSGWWAIKDLDDMVGEPEYYPTKRAAMVAIDADPPTGY